MRTNKSIKFLYMNIDKYQYVKYNTHIDIRLCKNRSYETLCENGLVDSRKDGSMTKYSIKKNSLENLREFIDIIDENIKKSHNTNIKGE